MFGDKEFGKHVGFPTPESTPEETTCITLTLPANAAWWAVYVGLLTLPMEESFWQQFEGGITPEQAAHCAEEIYLAAMDAASIQDGCEQCFLPTGERVIQQDDLGNWKMLDDGAWVQPTGDYTIPPLNARTEPTAEERRCAAAANAANVIKQLYEGLADEYASNHDQALFFIAIGVLVGTLFLPPLGLLATSFLEIATILVAEGFVAFAFLTADVWTEAFTDKFKCILLARSTAQPDDTVTFDFNAVINDLVNQLAFDIDFTLAQQRLAIQVGTILRYVGAEGLNYAGSTTAITTPDCTDCEPTWCYLWVGDEEVGNWSIYPGQPGSLTAGGYESGLTFAAGNPTRGRRQSFVQMLDSLSGIHVTHIRADYDITLGDTSAGIFCGIWINDFATNLALTTSFPSGVLSSEWDGDRTDIASLQLAAEVGACDGCGDPGGVALLTAIYLYGRGELPPFLTDGNPC